jgi:hypothetical protein
MAATGTLKPSFFSSAACTTSGKAPSPAGSGDMPLVIMITGTGFFSTPASLSMAHSTPAEATPSRMKSVSVPTAVPKSSCWKAVMPFGSVTLSLG